MTASVVVPGFQSSALLDGIRQAIENAPAAEKSAQLKSVNAIFQFDIKNDAGQVKTWVIDLKNKGEITLGTPSTKPDIILTCADSVFADLATGKINGQKAFMGGKLKIKGNMMLAMRLDNILKAPNVKAIQSPGKKSGAAPTAAGASYEGGIKVEGFVASETLNQLKVALATVPAAEKAQLLKVNAIFQFDLKNAVGKVQSFTVDLKKGDVYVGPAQGKPDVILTLNENDFLDITTGKLNGQKAFMSGKLKVKGQVMLATKLDSVFKVIPKKSKL